MMKIHTTLKTSTNIVFILVWGLVVAVLLSALDTWPIPILIAGTALGLIGGIMQLLSFKESKASFREAKSMIEVRRSFKKTKWGKRYIAFLWASNIMLVVIALASSKSPLLSLLVGYFLLMFIREIITLKPTIELSNA